MTSISFQGERGAYSEAAASSFFDGDVQTVPCITFADVLECVVGKKTDYAILPIENSIEGSVGESNDLLYSTELKVVGEKYYRIEHCLIGNGSLDEIGLVYSHPQALGQCRGFIQEHGMRTVPTYDTAGSVKIVKELHRQDIACIASRQASEIHKMPVIKDGIADNASNYTRFLILSDENARNAGNKTSIIFSIKHERDALYKIMKKFHEGQINLTKIESRPTKTTVGEYNFYVDFEGNEGEPRVARTIEKIMDEAVFFKSLGSYTADRIS